MTDHQDPAQAVAPPGTSERVQPDCPLSGEVEAGGAYMQWAPDEALTKVRPKKRRTGSHYTYVIRSEASRVKIGHSAAPKGRLSELQVGSPHELWLTCTWKSDREGAKLLERQMHAAFSWALARGEWFQVEPLEAEAVGNLFAAGRVQDAQRLAEILRTVKRNEREQQWLRRIWYNTPRKDRSVIDRLARVERERLDRVTAGLCLEAAALGYWEFGERSLRRQNTTLEHWRRSFAPLADHPPRNPLLPVFQDWWEDPRGISDQERA